MAFQLHIKNIGKLTDAKLDIGGFTVLAGPNNTGKSFVSKLLYSVFDAMNVNPALVHLDSRIANYLDALEYFEVAFDRGNDALVSLRADGEALRSMVAELPNGDFAALERIAPQLIAKVSAMLQSLSQMRDDFAKLSENEDFIFTAFPPRKNLADLESALTELKNLFASLDAMRFVVDGVRLKVEENLKHTFQVPRLSDLRGHANELPEVDIQGIGVVQLSNGEISGTLNLAGLRRLQQYSKVIYLESPVHWKLKSALEVIDLSGRRFAAPGRRRFLGIPGYFYDLAAALKGEYAGKMDFPEVFERITGAGVIDGKLVLSELGDLQFQQNGRSFTLPVTATGVANLGMLALLIEHKVLDRGTFLFIDEPEAHLHTAWQMVMAEALFALAKGGVNVVIATHSPDILKWLEVHVKKHPEDEALVALNNFPELEAFPEWYDFESKIDATSRKLTEPFSDLFVAGM